MRNPRTNFEIHIEDIHIDDLIARVRMKSFFRSEQKRRLEYDRDVAARVGRGGNWVHSTWRNEYSLLGTMQLMAYAFDYELRFEPKMTHDVWLKVDKTQFWQISAVLAANPDVEKRNEAARMDLCVMAGQIRKAAGIEDLALAKRLNTDRSKLLDWEEGNRPNYTVTQVQRHFRMLGAPLTLSVSPLGDGPDFEFPACKEEGPLAAAWLMRNDVNMVEVGGDMVIFNALRPAEVVRFPIAVWNEWVARAND